MNPDGEPTIDSRGADSSRAFSGPAHDVAPLPRFAAPDTEPGGFGVETRGSDLDFDDAVDLAFGPSPLAYEPTGMSRLHAEPAVAVPWGTT